MPNPFCHIELATDDVASAKSFYGKLFDWQLQHMPEMDYTMVNVGDDGTGGGIFAKPSPEAPTAWMPYVLVDDVAATLKKAASLGGQVLKQKQEIPNMGWFGIVKDPTGAILGVYQSARK